MCLQLLGHMPGHHVCCEACQASYEVYKPGFLLSKLPHKHSIHRLTVPNEVKDSHGGQNEHLYRCSVPMTHPIGNDHHGRLPRGMGEHPCPRILSKAGNPLRNPPSTYIYWNSRCLEMLAATDAQQDRPDPHGQLGHCVLHKSPRQGPVLPAWRRSISPLGMVHLQQHRSHCSLLTEKPECHSRQPKQTLLANTQMGTGPRNPENCIPPMGFSLNRPPCNILQCQMATILLPGRTWTQFPGGCLRHEMGSPLDVCLPPPPPTLLLSHILLKIKDKSRLILTAPTGATNVIPVPESDGHKTVIDPSPLCLTC